MIYQYIPYIINIIDYRYIIDILHHPQVTFPYFYSSPHFLCSLVQCFQFSTEKGRKPLMWERLKFTRRFAWVDKTKVSHNIDNRKSFCRVIVCNCKYINMRFGCEFLVFVKFHYDSRFTMSLLIALVSSPFGSQKKFLRNMRLQKIWCSMRYVLFCNVPFS